jgi:hypothetical protein
MVSSKCDKLVHTARWERANEWKWVSARHMGIVFSKFKQTQSVNNSNGWLIITIVITPWAKLRISSTASNPFFMNSFSSIRKKIVQLHINIWKFYCDPQGVNAAENRKVPSAPRGAWMLLCIFLFLFLRASAEGGWAIFSCTPVILQIRVQGKFMMNKITGNSHKPTHTHTHLYIWRKMRANNCLMK